jgi:hypothetical protein
MKNISYTASLLFVLAMVAGSHAARYNLRYNPRALGYVLDVYVNGGPREDKGPDYAIEDVGVKFCNIQGLNYVRGSARWTSSCSGTQAKYSWHGDTTTQSGSRFPCVTYLECE